MIHRKQLKKAARQAFRRNYWRAVIVCLVLAILVGAYGSFTSSNVQGEIVRFSFRVTNNFDILDTIARGITGQEESLAPLAQPFVATKGVLGGLFNSITQSGSFVFGVLNAVNQFVFGGRVLAGVISLLGAAILFLYWMFVGNLLRVGEFRFFLENRVYPETRVNRILFLFKIRRVRHTAYIMLCKTVFVVLWAFTIVGGPIKYYAYRMVPLLVAENPDISRKDAFRLSQDMMRGHKWQAFLLDMSFMGWYILSTFTLGILSYLYINPYKSAADAELYILLRQRAIARPSPRAALFNDPWLTTPAPLSAFPAQATAPIAVRTVFPPEATPGTPPDGPEPEAVLVEYPAQLFPVPEHPGRNWLTPDYHRKYRFSNLLLIFFTFCLIGWLWEVFVDLINTGAFVNRGTLHGPWLPLYGTAGALVVLIFRRWADKPVLTFFLVMGFCGLIEYFTGLALEQVTGHRWWDYTGYFLNIHGRVCLEGLLVFGVAGCLGIYFLGPIFDDLFSKIPARARNLLCTVLVVCFVSDLAYSARHPNLIDGEVPGAKAEAAAGVTLPLPAPPATHAVPHPAAQLPAD